MSAKQEQFDLVIGRLDRILSEFLLLHHPEFLDEANKQTLKHHADDLIGVGQAMNEKLGLKNDKEITQPPSGKAGPCEATID
jgi:hypothetical protein